MPFFIAVTLLNTHVLLGRLLRSALSRLSDGWSEIDRMEVCLPLFPQICIKLPKIVGPKPLEAAAFVLLSAVVLVGLCGLLEHARSLCRVLMAAQ